MERVDRKLEVLVKALEKKADIKDFEDLSTSILENLIGKNYDNKGEIFNNYNHNIASGYGSHAEGNGTLAKSDGCHAEGISTIAEGVRIIAGSNFYDIGSHAEGWGTIANGLGNHSEGVSTKATGYVGAHSEGCETEACGGYGSHAEGNSTTANGLYGSHAEGYNTVANGLYGSHAEGYNTVARGKASHAEGGSDIRIETETISNVTTKGFTSNIAHNTKEILYIGEYVYNITEVDLTGKIITVNIVPQFTEGLHRVVTKHINTSGDYSHTEGYDCYTGGNEAHAEGYNTIAINEAEHAEGKFNKSNSNTISSIGIGTSNTDRKNAVEVTVEGKMYVHGVGDFNGTNPKETNSLLYVLQHILPVGDYATKSDLANLPTFLKITLAEYDALTNKNENRIYCIVD